MRASFFVCVCVCVCLSETPRAELRHAAARELERRPTAFRNPCVFIHFENVDYIPRDVEIVHSSRRKRGESTDSHNVL